MKAYKRHFLELRTNQPLFIFSRVNVYPEVKFFYKDRANFWACASKKKKSACGSFLYYIYFCNRCLRLLGQTTLMAFNRLRTKM